LVRRARPPRHGAPAREDSRKRRPYCGHWEGKPAAQLAKLRTLLGIPEEHFVPSKSEQSGQGEELSDPTMKFATARLATKTCFAPPRVPDNLSSVVICSTWRGTATQRRAKLPLCHQRFQGSCLGHAGLVFRCKPYSKGLGRMLVLNMPPKKCEKVIVNYLHAHPFLQ
jgi:hypothetical protein